MFLFWGGQLLLKTKIIATEPGEILRNRGIPVQRTIFFSHKRHKYIYIYYICTVKSNHTHVIFCETMVVVTSWPTLSPVQANDVSAYIVL